MIKIISQQVLLFIAIIGFTVFSSCSRGEKKEANATKYDKVLVAIANRDSFDLNSRDSTLTTIALDSSKKMEIPATANEKLVVHHTAYSLLYSEEHEQAIWIAYELTSEETNKKFDRSDKFIVDPSIKTGSATNADYTGSGYDRGHLAPAADMSWSNQTMQESFYYSNMSPQDPSFNRGIWKKLEELVRTWAVENKALYVVTGPILTKGLPTIGPNKVSVPEYYYKVLLDYSEPDLKAIGFILPNKAGSGSIQDFAVSVDKVEKITGLDFFPMLPDNKESVLESSICISCWTWKATTMPSTNLEKGTSTSVQCVGITKSGSQCSRKTTDPSGFCYQHQ
jgi:endonuclease G